MNKIKSLWQEYNDYMSLKNWRRSLPILALVVALAIIQLQLLKIITILESLN